jgi:hypothetical protein
MLQESQRAMDIMRCRAVEQRRRSRIHLTLPATVSRLQNGTVERTALVRDINTLGVFFFCGLLPEIGEQMNIQFTFPDGNRDLKIICEGVVVRVEKSTAQAATGVALQFNQSAADVLRRVA